MYLPKYVLKLIEKLNERGYACFVVGGAIRSYLLKETIHDYDLTTSALPKTMKEIFCDYQTIDTGIEHGTVTVLIDHHPIEITTYRQDGEYKDHRHPTQVNYTTSLKEDLLRRDFTINAMCYHPSFGLIDYFDGQGDLKKGIIRCIGDPDRRFDEDALRILRALRFSARLNFSIEQNTLQTLYKRKDSLSFVSKERIQEELLGILSAKYAYTCLQDHRTILETVIPELSSLSNSAYQAIIASIQNEKTADPYIRLSLFLTPLQDHIEPILKTLKFSNKFLRTATNLTALQNIPFDTPIAMRHLLHRLTVPFDMYLDYRLSLDPSLKKETYTRLFKQVTRDAYCFSLKDLAIDGKDLLSLGYKGKDIGDILNALLENVMNEEIVNQKEALLSRITS